MTRSISTLVSGILFRAFFIAAIFLLAGYAACGWWLQQRLFERIGNVAVTEARQRIEAYGTTAGLLARVYAVDPRVSEAFATYPLDAGVAKALFADVAALHLPSLHDTYGPRAVLSFYTPHAIAYRSDAPDRSAAAALERPLLQEARRTGRNQVGVEGTESGVAVLGLAVVHAPGGSILGVVQVSLPLSGLVSRQSAAGSRERFAMAVRSSELDKAFATDDAAFGEGVRAGNWLYLGADRDLLQALRERGDPTQNPHPTVLQIHKRRHLVRAVAVYPTAGGANALLLSASDVEGSMRVYAAALGMLAILVCAVSAALLLGAIRKLRRQLVTPLGHLTDRLTDLSYGKTLDQPLAGNSIGEVGQMERAADRLRVTLNRAVQVAFGKASGN